MKSSWAVLPSLEALEPRLLLAVYYASPNGGGNGSASSPFQIADFWPKARAGDTLWLKDGVYTGARSTIAPQPYLKGTASALITVKALNDGKVYIDGQGERRPINLYDNDYFLVEGVNAFNSSDTVVSLQYTDHSIIRRVTAWDAAEGNNDIFGIHFGGYNLIEDSAGWGRARKIFSASQNGNNNTFRRDWGRFEASESVGNKMTFSTVYNNYNNLFENCIGTWDTSTGKMPDNYVLKDFDGSQFMRVSTTNVNLPNGAPLSGLYRPNGTQNGKPRYLDYYAGDSYIYLWWSTEKSAWVISQGTSSGPQLTNYWVKSTNPSSPTGTYTHGPTTTGSPVVELASYGGGFIGEAFGIYGSEGYWGTGWSQDSNLRILGSIAYITATQRAGNLPGLFFNTASSKVQIRDSAAFVDPANPGRYGTDRIKPFFLMNNREDERTVQNLVASDLTGVGTASYWHPKWSVSAVRQLPGAPMSLEAYQDSGATIKKRYVNGTLTTTDLWPWPMDQRIYDAMVWGGYSNPIYVTDEIARISHKPGDVNWDGIVNVGDLGIMAAHWCKTGARWADGDVNGDGTVNVGDLGIISWALLPQEGTLGLEPVLPEQPQQAGLAIQEQVELSTATADSAAYLDSLAPQSTTVVEPISPESGDTGDADPVTYRLSAARLLARLARASATQEVANSLELLDMLSAAQLTYAV